MSNNDFKSFDNFDPTQFPQFSQMNGANRHFSRFSAPAPAPTNTTIPCFKEDTQILSYVDGKEVFIKVQDIRPGMFIKTLSHGYLAVDMIGKKILNNPGDTARIPNRIYKCSKPNYPELIEDLFITGHHSILVDELNDIQMQEIHDLYNYIYITENKYRLPCFLDMKSEVVEKEESVNIYHIALENENYYSNYGIYANGLLVETCSKRYLKELSAMDLIL